MNVQTVLCLFLINNLRLFIVCLQLWIWGERFLGVFFFPSASEIAVILHTGSCCVRFYTKETTGTVMLFSSSPLIKAYISQFLDSGPVFKNI